MKLPDFIRKLRFDLRITQIEFSKKIKMKQSSISGWENGTRKLSDESRSKLMKFCQEHNIKMDLKD